MIANAAIYIADPSLLGSRFLDCLEDILSYESISDGNQATGIIITLKWGTMTLNFMPSDQLDPHLQGLIGYVRAHIVDDDSLGYALGRLNYVRMSLGCVIEHEEDSDDFVDFLFRFFGSLNGLLFFFDRLYDFTGDTLASSRIDD
ncbi:MAG: hypothetical protein ACI8UO_005047 [Verrucomicrobiales bacterium]|jgi:hypothetical protein